MKRLRVISDLHIREATDPTYESLLGILRNAKDADDTVVLAGDIFDCFVGNKSIFLNRYHKFLEELRQASNRGVVLRYIEGNHDFLLQKAFEGIAGLRVEAEFFEMNAQGKRFYIAHGDKIDGADYGYRALRAFFRSPIMRGLVFTLPGDWLDMIGRKSSAVSRKSGSTMAAELPTERILYLRKVYRNFAAEKLCEGYDFVVLGHCHDLDEMQFAIGERKGQYMNMGYPPKHRSYIQWSEDYPDEISRIPLDLLI